MSSTERAPEPTMEEILASIRRIISDDNSSATERGATSASVQDEARPDAADAEADTRIIDDIARVLSEAAPGSAGDDDILDLTKELGPADATMDEGPLETATDLDVAAEVPQPAAYTSDTFATSVYASDTYASGVNAGVEAEPEAGTTEPMSALDAAIAALRAGIAPIAEPAPEPPSELVLSDVEVAAIIQEPVAGVVEPAADDQAFWPPSQLSWAQNGEATPEPAPPRVNGGSSHEPHYTASFSGATLQDSVKATLRPLLRQWIDTHMSRVLEAALRDELKDADEDMSRLLTAALRDELEDAETRRRGS
jgi:cell pole-organizing protein PopZ